MPRPSHASILPALVSILALACLTGCSSDDCPTTPGTGNGGRSLSSTVLAPQPFSADFRDIHVAGTQDIFLLSGTGMVLRRQGTEWTTHDTGIVGYAGGMWGTSATDVFAVGNAGVIVHFDGSTWSSMSSGTFQDLRAIHGTAADNVYAVGRDNTVLHYDGTAWSPVAVGTPQPDSYYRNVWCAPTGEVFMTVGRGRPYYDDVVLRYDGDSDWAVDSLPDDYLWRGLWGTASDNVLVGCEGNIYRFDGAAWHLDHALGDYVNDIHGTGPDDIWASGGSYGSSGEIAHFDGTDWTSITAPTTSSSPYSLMAVSPTEVYGLNGAEIVAWDGTAWSRLNDEFVTSRGFDALWGSATDGIWMHTDGGAAYNFDGSEFTEVATGAADSPRAAWGLAADDIYAVGENGTIVHYDGMSWSVVPHGLGTADLTDIWGTAADDIWVSSYQGVMWHYDGTTWTEHDAWSSDYRATDGVWGAAADDYYAVVSDWDMCIAGVMHYDGTEWTPMSLGGYYPKAVHGVSASEVYFVANAEPDCPDYVRGQRQTATEKSATQLGPGGSVLIRYDGTTGAMDIVEMGIDPRQVWALGTDNVFVVGEIHDEIPVVGHYDGASVVLHQPQVYVWIRDIWGSGTDTLYLAGSEGTLVQVMKN